jgi:ribosomal protein S6--L-glutamate ligase
MIPPVSRMRGFLIIDRRRHGTPTRLLREVIERLEQRGIAIDYGVAEEMVVAPETLTPRYDFYLLKSYTDLGLSLAGILHRQGARILNPYPACAVLRDKVETAWRLRAAGIPAPRTWATGDPALLSSHLEDGPLIIKPARGVHGSGVCVVRSRRDLRRVRERLGPAPGQPLVAQHLVNGAGEDLKVYVSGERVFGVRKAWSETSYREPGRPRDVPPEARRIALRVGQAFGLSLYGLDLIETRSGPVVVDVNYFPGFRGVPSASAAVTDEIDRFASRVPTSR